MLDVFHLSVVLALRRVVRVGGVGGVSGGFTGGCPVMAVVAHGMRVVQNKVHDFGRSEVVKVIGDLWQAKAICK